MRHQPTQPAFTLLELLVVLAIIAIIAVLGFPVVTRTLEKAKTTRTIENLRSLHQANSTYAAENDGSFVPLMTGNWSGGWKWNGDFLQYLGISDTGSEEWQQAMNSGFWSPERVNSTIGYNSYKSPGSPAPWSEEKSPLRIFDPQKAATMVAFMDANDWWIDPYRYDRWESQEASDVEDRSPGASAAYRNSGRTAAAITFAGSIVMLEEQDLDWRTNEGKARWFYDGQQ